MKRKSPKRTFWKSVKKPQRKIGKRVEAEIDDAARDVGEPFAGLVYVWGVAAVRMIESTLGKSKYAKQMSDPWSRKAAAMVKSIDLATRNESRIRIRAFKHDAGYQTTTWDEAIKRMKHSANAAANRAAIDEWTRWGWSVVNMHGKKARLRNDERNQSRNQGRIGAADQAGS